MITSLLLPIALFLPLAPAAEHASLARLTAGARVTMVTPLGEQRAALEGWDGEDCASRITLRLDDGRTRTPSLDWSAPGLAFDAGRSGASVTIRAAFGGDADSIEAVSLRLASEDEAADALRALRSLRLACAPVR